MCTLTFVVRSRPEPNHLEIPCILKKHTNNFKGSFFLPRLQRKFDRGHGATLYGGYQFLTKRHEQTYLPWSACTEMKKGTTMRPMVV